MSYVFHCTVQPDWIDYNGHMRDAYYGLVFSLAVDAFQDEVGFDAAYRAATGCTIYLLEDHKYFLAEVKNGAELKVETRLIGVRPNRFLLQSCLSSGGVASSVGEFLELHVQQRPEPHAAAIPDEILARLQDAVAPRDDALPSSRVMALTRS
ncbi:MAG: thioesterase family protein [Pseudomonadota bacterium]